MARISGWSLNGESESESDSRLARIADDVGTAGGFRGHRQLLAVVAAESSDASIARDETAGTGAVICGSPRWDDPDLDGVSRERGAAASLLSAYERHGDALLERLTGDFALAVVDDRNKRILLAVDRMGVQRLCYAESEDGNLVFGSTTRAVLRHLSVGRHVSHQSVFDYVYFHVIPSPRTIYRDIRKLQPGEMLWFENGSAHVERYWIPRSAERDGADVADLKNLVQRELSAAVGRSWSVADTGCFLSGGIDSSTICGLANEISESPAEAFCIGFNQQGFDEMEFARTTAKHFNLSLNEYYVTATDVANSLDRIALTFDEPFGNSSAIPVYFCAVKAKEHGLGRLLAGDGGDELFAGNERYAKQQIFERYYRVPGPIRRSILEPLARRLPTDWSWVTRKAARYIEQAKLPLPDRFQTYNLVNVLGSNSIFSPELLGLIDVDRPPADSRRWYQQSESGNLLDAMLFFDWKLTLADNDLRKVSTMCEAAGIDVAYPMLDDAVVDASIQVPAEQKIRRGELRYFFKNTYRGFLAPDTLVKEKQGFGLPFGDWLLNSEELRAIVLPALSSLDGRGILNDGFAGSLLKRHEEEHAAFFGNLIWVLVVLELWLAENEPGFSI